jgi:hypothetical protein
MPERLTPPGYRAVIIGSAGSIEELGAFAPMEEGSDEGTLMLMRLDFEEFLSDETLTDIEQAFVDAGVERWPGYQYIVLADMVSPSIYLAWQKGMPWLPIIIGLLATMILPPLLGGVIWMLLPESLKQTINTLIGMGMMLLVMFLMMQVVKPLTAPERPKRLEETRK